MRREYYELMQWHDFDVYDSIWGHELIIAATQAGLLLLSNLVVQGHDIK